MTWPGVHVVHVPNRKVTHHLLSTYSANPIVAASLLSACQFVKPEWLDEVIRAEGIPLEQSFELPAISKYRPGYSASLSLYQKEFRVWEPNEERLTLFAEYRFLCVDEKGRELGGDFRELIERGGGSFEAFDPNSGRGRFHKALARGRAKEGKIVVVVGKRESIQAAIGKDGWEEFVAEAKEYGQHLSSFSAGRLIDGCPRFGLTFLEPEVLVQVVINADVRLFAARSSMDMDVEEGPLRKSRATLPDTHTTLYSSASIPDIIPNTHSDEPSVAPPEPEQRTGPTRRLVRRVTSRQPSQEPASTSEPIPPEPELQEPPAVTRPRRVRVNSFPPISCDLDDRFQALTRRLNAGVPVVTGLDDPSSILDSVPDLTPRASPTPLAVPIPDRTVSARCPGIEAR